MATESDKEQSPLIKAVLENDINAVKSLVESGAVDIDAVDDSERTALMLAASMENGGEIVKYLVENDAYIDAQDKDGKTALMYAASNKNNGEIVKYLARNRADIDIQDDFGKTALMYAVCKENNGDIVKYLVDRGARVNAQSKLGYTALIYAANLENNGEIIKYLVENGANVNAQNGFKETALLLAAERGNNGEVVKYLVEKGADVDVKNNFGFTPLMLVVGEENNADAVKYLVDRGADVNARNDSGYTALMVAASKKNNVEVVKYLVKKGADVNVKGLDGKTALMLAGKEDNEDVFNYLKKHGADLTIKDKEGMGITSYYPESLSRECREQQRWECKYEKDPNLWKNIQQNTIIYVCDEDVDYLGYTAPDGRILLVKNQVIEPSELTGRKSSDGRNVEGDVYPPRNAFELMMTFVHEGNHRLNFILDCASDYNFTAEQNVKVNYCTEAVAHTSECLAAALQYQRMKKAGIGTFQCQDSEGNLQDVPIEQLLNAYSPELREYVTKNGFDPNNKKDVEAVTEIGLQFWEKRKRFYVKPGGQFDTFAKPKGTGEGISQKKFDALINRMCEGVVIGDGVELDLRQFADRFNGMTDAEAQRHVSRANDNTKQETKNSVENSEKVALKSEIGEQTGEKVVLVADYKERQDHFDEMVNGRSKGQSNTVTRQGAVEPTKKQEKPLNLALLNANRGRA